MCMDCWNKYGAPKIVNSKTLGAQELIDEVYVHHAAGGGLHVLLDDWNLHCVTDRFESINDTPEQVEAELRCLRAFREMTEEERASALAIYDKMFDPCQQQAIKA